MSTTDTPSGPPEALTVAVACDGNEVSPHFGRCEGYAIARIADGQAVVEEWLPNPGHEPGLLPRLMQERGVQCVVAGGAGPRAVGLLAEAGIELIQGASGPAAEVIQALAAGTLTGADSTCEH